MKRIEMNFLPDVYVTCDVCRGKRYNSETLQVKYKNYSIADLLGATVEEAITVLENLPQIQAKLRTLIRRRSWLHSSWDSRRRRFPAAKRSVSSSQKNSAGSRPEERSTYSMSRQRVCTSKTSGVCSMCCTNSSRRATRSW